MGYTCYKCKRTSYNPSDVRYRYCGFCHRFEEDSKILKSTWFTRVIGFVNLFGWSYLTYRSESKFDLVFGCGAIAAVLVGLIKLENVLWRLRRARRKTGNT